MLWGLWLAYWAWAARGVKPAARTESRASRLSRALPIGIAILLLVAPTMPGWLGRHWARSTWTLFGVGVLLAVAGLGFTVWARRALGRNWSARVTIKDAHEIVRVGPYRWIRHPIYTGILLAFLGSAIARPQWRGLLAFTLVAVSYVRKLRLEERWLGDTFGAAYAEYRRGTWALIPFLL
jgi:protein-S-isoprenylcysteine O-methyltransferase Ste14